MDDAATRKAQKAMDKWQKANDKAQERERKLHERQFKADARERKLVDAHDADRHRMSGAELHATPDWRGEGAPERSE